MALWYRALEIICIREYDILPCPCLYQAVVYRLCHRPWTRILAFYYVLACQLLECPYYRLRWGRFEVVGHRVYAIAVEREYHEIVLSLRFLGDWDAENLVCQSLLV
jgi:hypothetical protein